MAVRITGAGVALTVGIILVTGLIIGGFFWARHAGDQARRDEAVQIAQEQLEEQSNKDVALNEGDKDGSSDKSENGNGSTDKQEGAGSENGTNDDIPATGHDASDEETVDELPQTGASDGIAAVVLGFVTFASVAYYRSRRALLEL